MDTPTLDQAHDDLVRVAIASAKKLTWPDVADAFIAGVGGSDRRWVTVVDAYSLCAKLPDHPFTTVPEFLTTCGVCGAYEATFMEHEGVRNYTWQGFIWGRLTYAVITIDELLSAGPVEPTRADHDVFAQVLGTLATVPPDTSPSGAAALVGKNKVMPKSNAGIRLRTLEGLAACGVMPQDMIASRLDTWVDFAEEARTEQTLGRSHRAETPLPLAAWRGANGIDADRVTRLFGTDVAFG